MKHSKFNFRSFFMVLVLACGCIVSQAQDPGDPGGGPGDPGGDPDPAPQQSQDIPFDGGLSLVAAAGVAYAAKKGYDKRKKAADTSNS